MDFKDTDTSVDEAATSHQRAKWKTPDMTMVNGTVKLCHTQNTPQQSCSIFSWKFKLLKI
jgi:hypothetical protein